MERFQAMRLFTRIVELGSFTKAADDLQLPRATVTLGMQELERRLGTRLLHRTTRHVSTTPDGEAYYERCQRLLSDLEETEAVFDKAGGPPRGKLRVNLQGTLAKHFVLPVIGDFFARYPAIELEIGLGDRDVDLVREAVDCVLRAGQLRDSSLVARRVASLQQVTCASREYLARHGTPDTVEALRGHRAVSFLSQRTGKPMPFDFIVEGATKSVQLRGVVAVSDADAYHACCAAHLGLIQLPRYHIAPMLADGRLCEVLADFRPEPMTVSVLYPHNRQLSPRVRVFVDWLAEVMERAS
ncbi:LysR family transcriptional regulator [Rhodoferax koreense]|uniref:LysR family transcriptional regulator n=1 Tax=Rhodoferax koreensis TaxID=1842727 RepID=A0A1P8K1U2_9BURK|nr:LysR family transcriptional regulator [Rhodoferax koreense]APW39978.1 LysR family transcriptional regulator [Rhodoferax koreense]